MFASCVTVAGNLTDTPQLRFTATGTPVCNFQVAVAQIQPDGKGGWHEQDVSFFRVTAWRSLAEHAAASLAKGNRVVVAGRLKTNTWETPEGQLRTVFEIVAEEVAPSLRFGVTTFEKRGAGTREDAEQFHEPAAC